MNRKKRTLYAEIEIWLNESLEEEETEEAEEVLLTLLCVSVDSFLLFLSLEKSTESVEESSKTNC